MFDKKQTFIPDIKEIKPKFIKTLNILKLLSDQSYVPDQELLLRVHTAMFVSRLYYGSVVYGSALRTALNMLDPVLHLVLRLASGAFGTSLAHSLYVECNNMLASHPSRAWNISEQT